MQGPSSTAHPVTVRFACSGCSFAVPMAGLMCTLHRSWSELDHALICKHWKPKIETAMVQVFFVLSFLISLARMIMTLMHFNGNTYPAGLQGFKTQFYEILLMLPG